MSECDNKKKPEASCVSNFRNVFEDHHVPKRGRYHNSLVEDSAGGKFYIYDACGSFIQLPSSNGGGEGGSVDSVNGFTGVVTLTADSISDLLTTHKFITAAEKSKLAGIAAGAQVNTVFSVNGQTGDVVIAGGGGGGSGGFTRTVAASNALSASADYVCDGIDDHVQINSAIADCTGAGGGTVRLSQGLFIINANVLVQSGVILEGQGWSSILKLKNSSATFSVAGIVRIKNASTEAVNAGIRNFQIDGNKSNQSVGTNKYGIYHEGTNCFIENIYVHDTCGYGIDPHENNGGYTTGLIIRGCHVIDCGDATLGVQDGITLDKCENSIVEGNVVAGAYRHGISLVTGSRNNNIRGNTVRGCITGNGLNLNGTSVSTPGCFKNSVTGNNVSTSLLAGIRLAKATSCVVQGNTFAVNGQAGIELDRAKYNTINGNTLSDNGQTTTNTYSDIYIGETSGEYSTYNSIVGNTSVATLTAKVKYGIEEETINDDYNIIVGNTVLGAVTGTTNILGVNSQDANNTV